jgi:uncharacterized protein (TIGR01777 family)
MRIVPFDLLAVHRRSMIDVSRFKSRLSATETLNVSSFTHQSILNATPDEAFEWHERPGAFERLSPPWEQIEVLERTGGIRDGDRLRLRLRRGPFQLHWEAEHRGYTPGRQFRDEQVKGPFSRWSHTHRFKPDAEGHSILQDHVEYALPLGLVGRLLGRSYTQRSLLKMFAHRHQTTRADLTRHKRFADRGAQRVAVTGSFGLVGSQLTAFLTSGGHHVSRMVRRAPSPDSGEVFWNPERGETDTAALEGVDAVVHLAGENIASGRWTKARKESIARSRIDGTRLLSEALSKLSKPPRVLLAASAIGYYGDRGNEILTEDSPAKGHAFITDVCREWEAATKPAEEAGIRVVHLRLGVVLSRSGGALAKMITPFSLGLGGVLSHGRQYMSWISLEDVIGAIQHAMFTEELRGPVNLVAPHPVTNRTFTKTLGRVLRRPTLFPVPAVAVKALFGQMGEELLLNGARVVPKKLLDNGFEFLYPDLEDALRAELGRFS